MEFKSINNALSQDFQRLVPLYEYWTLVQNKDFALFLNMEDRLNAQCAFLPYKPFPELRLRHTREN